LLVLLERWQAVDHAVELQDPRLEHSQLSAEHGDIPAYDFRHPFVFWIGNDPQQVLTILIETMHGSRFNKIYGDKIAKAQYAPGNFAFPLVLKDIRLALNEAESAGVPMPAISVVRDRLISGIARGYARRDWSALGMLAATDAGLIPEPEKTSN